MMGTGRREENEDMIKASLLEVEHSREDGTTQQLTQHSDSFCSKQFSKRIERVILPELFWFDLTQ